MIAVDDKLNFLLACVRVETAFMPWTCCMELSILMFKVHMIGTLEISLYRSCDLLPLTFDALM